MGTSDEWALEVFEQKLLQKIYGPFALATAYTADNGSRSCTR